MESTERMVWIVNKAENPFEKTSIELRKHIVLKQYVPQQVPLSIGLKWSKQYNTLSLCSDPNVYFKHRKLKQLIIRDAGIGDLLLLEPILRQLCTDGKREVNVLSRFPEVFYNNPHITDNLFQEDRDVIPKTINMDKYDSWEDLRFYSETCSNREKKCRTDCYNQKFNVSLSDPEPRIYFDPKEKSLLKKDTDKIYIGVACDGSHSYRRYDNGDKLIQYLINKNKKYVVVLLGRDNFVNAKKHKRLIDLQGKTDVRQSINVIKNLDYMISVDSGLMHVALCMHIPTVCIFSIIKPELRLHYYTGPYQSIFKTELNCIGCGSFHMSICKHGNKDKNPKFVAPCLQIEPKLIYEKMTALEFTNHRRLFYSDGKIKKKNKVKSTSIIKSSNKITVPMIVQNEEKNLPRFIELVLSHPTIGRVVAIDGGSNDNTVELLKKAGAEVYIHPYIKTFHEQQAMQRNISFSYIRDGERCFVFDVDECMSKELSDYLPVLADSDIGFGLVSRRTFNYYKDIDNEKKQIKDYPDWQPRFYTWDRKFKFVGGAHHVTLNTPEPIKIQKDIIHFEKEGKDRNALERQWAGMQSKVKELRA
jgi:ADP-heptose:LPS heptosyltransferase